MVVRVDACWGGGRETYFMLTLPNSYTIRINAEQWNRNIASYAKDSICRVYKGNRRNIRFKHR